MRAFSFLFLLFSSFSLLAIDEVSIDINSLLPADELDLGNKHWHINNISAVIKNPLAVNQSLVITLSQISYKKKLLSDVNFKLECFKFNITPDNIHCDSGKLFLDSLDLANKNIKLLSNLSFNYIFLKKKFSLTLTNFKVAGATGHVKLYYHKKNWNIISKLKSIDILQLKKYLNFFLIQNKYLDNITGHTDINIEARGNLLDILSLNIFSKVKQLNINWPESATNPETLAENLEFDISLRLQKKIKQNKPGYSFKTTLKNTAGAVFIDPYYVEFKGNESLNINGIAYLNEKIKVKQLNLSLGNDFRVSGDMVYLLNQNQLNHKQAVAKANFVLESKHLEQLQKNYLDNLISGTEYENLQLSGQIKFSIKKINSHISADAFLNGLTISLPPMIEVNRLSGKLYWDDASISAHAKIKQPKKSLIFWDNLKYKKVTIAKSHISFYAQNDHVTIKKPIVLPIYDGKFIMKNMRATQIFDDLIFQFDGVVEPISLDEISQQMQLSLFNGKKLKGKISALIPNTHYTKKQLRLGGKLWINIFDGNFSFDQVKISDPGTNYSQITAQVGINNVSLLPLTQTLDFGKMHGRVGGYVKNLYLVNWEPKQFDLFLGTPENDQSNHLISQRAIDNISSMGGLPGILSKGIMSIFENFGYDKLGLGCQLLNGRCKMRGVEIADKGNAYYIVKGGGIPRIDIMGYETNVDWNTLIHRLNSIQQSNQETIVE